MCGICGCGQEESDHHHHDEQVQTIKLEQDIMAKNEQYAAENQAYFAEHHILALNLVSSPGSGKTTLLENTIKQLKADFKITVIEGDQQTDHDAQRIAATGVAVKQINTGKSCHLDAHQIGHAVKDLQVPDDSILFIENVGNLICPALFNLGAALRTVILSVTEGEDKPLKYPDMFQQSDIMLLNKIDLLPHLNFDVEQCCEYARQVNPNIKILQVSAITGEGMSEWYDAIRDAYEQPDAKQSITV